MTYDLTREPWIPVRYVAGEEGPPAVGLHDALAEAHRIREIEAPPLQTAALYRLLQALFVRLYVHPPEADDDSGWTDDAWFSLWDRVRDGGGLDPDRVDTYLDRWRDQFDLVHPKHPFYGHPAPDKTSGPMTSWLVPTWARGNNETLFDHTTDAKSPPLDLADAVRALLATQAYDLSGRAKIQRTGGSLLRGLIFWNRGCNLCQALMLNTPPTRTGRMPSGVGDLPAWERNLPELSSSPKPERPIGYMDYLTWQSRFIQLVTSSIDGRTVVTEVHLRQGRTLDKEVRDPLMAFRTDSDGEIKPLKLNSGEALWRSAPTLFGTRLERKGDLPPGPFEWLTEAGLSPADADAWEVESFGVATERGGKAVMVRTERLTACPPILGSEPAQARMDEAVRRAERQSGSLRRALWACAVSFVASTADKVQKQPLSRWIEQDSRFQNTKNSTIRRIRGVADGLQGERRFWALLDTGFSWGRDREPSFEGWLDDLSALAREHDGDALLLAADRHLARWTRALHRAAQRAYDEATEGLVGTPRRMEAVAVGRDRLRPAAAYAGALATATP